MTQALNACDGMEGHNMTEDARKPGRGRIYDSITQTIGDTPLVRFDRIAAEKGVVAHLLGKRFGVKAT